FGSECKRLLTTVNFRVARNTHPEWRFSAQSGHFMLKATLRIAMLYRPIAIVERGRSIPMLRVAKVTVRIAFATGAAVTFSDRLEVALYWCICRRCRRTVIFFEGEAEGRCTPTGHTFGRLTGKEVTQNGSVASVVYRVVYWYEPFLDAKYPDK